jgi:hypothetical protein
MDGPFYALLGALVLIVAGGGGMAARGHLTLAVRRKPADRKPKEEAK